ncbi:MAG: TetR/AcrR family transcriptional regulator [Streptosporangiaceae bacterium]
MNPKQRESLTISQHDLELDDQLPIGGSALQRRLAEAAIELFGSRGAPATSVREVTAACGLSPGALYNHFASKDDLLYVLVRDIHLQFDAQMAATVASAGPDPAAQLAATVRFLVSRTARSKNRSRVANREFTALSGSRRQEITTLRRRIRDRLTGILLAGAEAGMFHLPGGDDLSAATLTSATITAMCVHISEWTLNNYPLSLEELQARYVEMTLRIAGAAG